MNQATITASSVGELLRIWRVRRRLSQLDLAGEAGVSTKHLSFLETGRSVPSRDMLLRLARCMDIPLRERNVLLTSAGYAPMFMERSLDDPALAIARDSVDAVLKAHEPYPALAVDRHWTVIAANQGLHTMVAGADPLLLKPPINMLRLSLHPAGLAPRIANLREWRDHVINRLRLQVDQTGDAFLTALLQEIRDYPLPPAAPGPRPRKPYDGIIVPFRLVTIDGTLSFFSTTTLFDTPVDVTLSEIRIEAFYPADAETAEIMRRMANGIPTRTREELSASIVTHNRYPVLAGDDPPPAVVSHQH